MIAWKLLTLKSKLIIGVVAFAAICYAGRQWLNRHDSRIERESRIRMSQEITKQKQAEWKAKDAELDAKAASIDAARKELDESLKSSLSAIQAERRKAHAAAIAVPADRLTDTIRALSRRLDAERTGPAPTSRPTP